MQQTGVIPTSPLTSILKHYHTFLPRVTPPTHFIAHSALLLYIRYIYLLCLTSTTFLVILSTSLRSLIMSTPRQYFICYFINFYMHNIDSFSWYPQASHYPLHEIHIRHLQNIQHNSLHNTSFCCCSSCLFCIQGCRLRLFNMLMFLGYYLWPA